MIFVLGPKDGKLAREKQAINTTSSATGWSRGLSPFFLGPVQLYNRIVSETMENAWQYAKVYPCHLKDGCLDTTKYFSWAHDGWRNPRAIRYPFGKGARPAFSLWAGKQLGYIEAREQIYLPLYARAVVQTEAFRILQEKYKSDEDMYLWDFDGYQHREMGLTLEQVLRRPEKTMGHAFVLAMLLEEEITVLPDLTVKGFGQSHPVLQ